MAMTSRCAAVLAVAAALGFPASAVANGAFPESESVIVPADRPHEIILATNFGLVSSEDDGASWEWSCETETSYLGRLYQISAPPLDRLAAVASKGLVYSDTRGCNWNIAGGALADKSVFDFFPNPAEPTHVLALAIPLPPADSRFLLLQSNDGGRSFAAPSFTAPAGLNLTGVEVARSDRRVIYLSGRSTDGRAQLVRSNDGGGSWSTQDFGGALATVGAVRLIGIHPTNPDQVFLRVIPPDQDGDRLAITDDGGRSARLPLTLPGGPLLSFIHTSSGRIWAAGDAGKESLVYRSDDQGMTFTAVPDAPHLRGFAERAGILYAATSEKADGFALAKSVDQGTTWERVMSYRDVLRTRSCLAKLCQSICEQQVQIGLWAPTVCSGADPVPNPVDAAGDPVAGSPDGCACSTAATPVHPSRLALDGLAALVFLRRRYRAVRAKLIQRRRVPTRL